MHVSDLFPTLLRLARVKTNHLWKLDGIDQWNVINSGGFPVRHEMINIDDVFGFGAYILSSFKLVNGTLSNGMYDGWLSSKGSGGDQDSQKYAKSVLASEASKAISTSEGKSRLTCEKILELRQKATVTCSNNVQRNRCNPLVAPCLFDIIEDPCEENNLANERPALLKSMLKRYLAVKNAVVPSRRRPVDPACDPINFNLNWNWWQVDS
jgi:arylsulfatase B